MTRTPQQITERLETIDDEVEERQGKGENAAEKYHEAKRAYEMEYAKLYVTLTGSPMDKKQKATAGLERSEAFFALKEAEGAYEGWKAAMRSRELSTSINQSLLRHQREMGG